MPSPTQEIHEQIALTIARRADEVVRKVLNERLGYSDWTPTEIAHRVVFIAEKDGSGTYVLDGTPVLWLGPVRLSHNEWGPGVISVNREWRQL